MLKRLAALRVKEVLQDEGHVLLGELRGRLQAQVEVPVVRAVGGEGLELHQERRNQVERHPDGRKFAQQRDHPVVVLQGVEANPGEDVLAGDQIFVVRLVHVPEEGDLGHKC